MKRVGVTTRESLPGALPPGERVLWCGGPDGAQLARYALHVRKFAVYFALLLGWRLLAVWRDGWTADAAFSATVTTIAIAVAVLAALRLYAAASARNTSYTITSERIVVRTGIALSIAVNLPFSKIASADVRRRADGGGDVELTLVDGARAGYVILWPSAKPLHFAKTVPMLRALKSVDVVADVLADALRRHAGASVSAERETVAADDGALAATG